MSDGRTTTAVGALARSGFNDPAAALEPYREVIARLGWDDERAEQLLDELELAADPDAALAGIYALSTSPQLVAACAEPGWRRRLIAVLGASLPLNKHLIAHPDDIEVLAAPPRRQPASEIASRLRAAAEQGADTLRLANRRELIRIAAADLTSDDPCELLDQIAAELADLADAVMACALDLARAEVRDQELARIAIVAMGKCGAKELNYLSDIDVIYVAEPASDGISQTQAVDIATKIAAATARICSAHTGAGSIWQVDAGLRPEGNSGPLVRTLEGMANYYQKWAKNWEFQALLKARPMAGDPELGRQFCQLTAQRVWQVGAAENFITELSAMRQRVISLVPTDQANREVKLGAGGLRDVEFSVQLLQLVHGRADDRLRVPATLPALRALVDAGYVGRADGADLAAAYRFERVMEHRIQLFRLRRSHVIPDSPSDLQALARAMGEPDGAALLEHWRKVSRQVLRLRQRVFFSPLLGAVSRLSTDEIRLSPQAAEDRLKALGFSDPAAALRHMGALTTGITRTADIQRQLMPAMLEWFAEGPNPDLGLLGFRQLSDSMGSTSWYLRALRDEGPMAERVAKILSSSRYIADLLRRDPPSVQLLAHDDDLRPRSRDALFTSMRQITDRHEDGDDAIAAVRALRRRELFRLAVGDVLGLIDLDALGKGLSDLAGASVQASLDIAIDEQREPVPPIAVVAMGRWGGGELSYASDADALFVVPDGTDAAGIAAAIKAIGRARALLHQPGPEPALDIDADLRPEGRDGALVRTLAGYLSYYRRWSSTWEAQALIRASRGAGDVELTDRFLAAIDEFRWPVPGLTTGQITEIRKLKARMEHERIDRSADPTRNTKLGPGGLVDVEWVIQLVQLEHAGADPSLRSSATMMALQAERVAGLISEPDAAILADAWRLTSRLRNKIMLVRNRASDQIPADPREIAAVALLLGYEAGAASALIEDYLRAARHASGVVTRLFWGADDRVPGAH